MTKERVNRPTPIYEKHCTAEDLGCQCSKMGVSLPICPKLKVHYVTRRRTQPADDRPSEKHAHATRAPDTRLPEGRARAWLCAEQQCGGAEC